jgi:hypothetical protein
MAAPSIKIDFLRDPQIATITHRGSIVAEGVEEGQIFFIQGRAEMQSGQSGWRSMIDCYKNHADCRSSKATTGLRQHVVVELSRHLDVQLSHAKDHVLHTSI